MRQNSTLGIIIALLVALGLGVGAYLYLNNTTGGDTPPVGEVATEIPPPDIEILEAASDIPANRLITGADREVLFQVSAVRPNDVAENDVRADEFSSLIQGQVTKVAIRGGDRIKKEAFRPAGIAELIPTAVPGQSSRKAMTVFINDLGNIAADGNTADIIASYNVSSWYMEFNSVDEKGIFTYDKREYPDITTKVIGQNIPVLRVIPPAIVSPEGAAQQAPVEPAAVPAEGEVIPPPQPTAEPVFVQGSQWQVVLAVTEQEAELIDYTRNKPGFLSLIIRRADDQEIVSTTGVTMDLLMRLYGVNQAYAQPHMVVDLVDAPPPPQPPGQPPVVIPIPFPFGNGAPVALPTTVPAATPTP
jgi:pilus assembly protein CpaB